MSLDLIRLQQKRLVMFNFLSRVLRLRTPFVAIVPIAIALIYKHCPLSSKIASFPNDDHINKSIPPLFSIADIHGDYPRALAALVHAGVVDQQGNWNAGNATFVKTRTK